MPNTPFMHDYVSAPRTPNFLQKLFPSAYFVASLAHVAIRASQQSYREQYTGEMWANDSLKILQTLESLGVTVNITGMNVLQKIEGPCVFVSNHMSTLETLMLPSMIQPWKDMCFVIKENLANYPIFRYVLRSRQSIVVTRTNPRKDFATILDEGAERLERGMSVLIFPQSTRSVEFIPTAFNSIGVKLAKKAGVPIVPIALHTGTMGQGTWIKDFGTIHPHIPTHFAFGEPITIEGNGKEAHATCLAFVQDHLAQWAQMPKD